MEVRPFVYSALAYVLVTFPLAALWHAQIFRGLYDEIGYFGGEGPSFILGMLAIVTQGVILSLAFPRFCRNTRTVGAGFKYGVAAGAFYWTCHVVGFAAKGGLASVPLFFAIETPYMLLQFGIYGVLLGWIYARAERSKQ